MDKRSPKSFVREKADGGPPIDLAYREELLPQMSIGGEVGGEVTPGGSYPVLSLEAPGFPHKKGYSCGAETAGSSRVCIEKYTEQWMTQGHCL